MLIDSHREVINTLAEKWSVKPDIHPNDFIFRFLYENPTFPTKDDAIRYYFNDGQKSAHQLLRILIDICKYTEGQQINMLEFASGYGCVTRHLRNELPFVSVTACDIHSEAQFFVNNKLEVNAVLSTSQPEKLILKEKYDVIFALSFFSHMPKMTFGRWLRQLISLLKPGGHIIFTTHGVASTTILPNVQFDGDGFWFQSSSEQKDLDTSEYGLTCTRPEYVFLHLFEEPYNRLLYYHEAYWWTHQDVYVVRRDLENMSRKMNKPFHWAPNLLINRLKKLMLNR